MAFAVSGRNLNVRATRLGDDTQRLHTRGAVAVRHSRKVVTVKAWSQENPAPDVQQATSRRTADAQPDVFLTRTRFKQCVERPNGARRNAPGSIFITGVSSGIGHATALHFGKAGWNVFGTVMSKEEKEAAECVIPNAVKIMVADVRDDKTIEKVAKEVNDELGDMGLDVLYNNVGVATCGPMELTPTKEVRAVFEVNVFGTWTVTRAFLPLLRKKANLAKAGKGRFPRILCITSMMGKISMPWAATYATSKSAEEAMADALRLELQPQGIKVCVIEPRVAKTGVPSQMWRTARDQMDSEVPEMQNVYKKDFEKGIQMMQLLTEYGDVPVAEVVNMIWRASTAQRPYTRYSDFLTGLGVFLRVRVMTDGMWDSVWLSGQYLQGVLTKATKQVTGRGTNI